MSNIYLKQRKNAGFTLIELLTVVAIIGILASVVLGYLNDARSKARDTNRQSEIREIQKALELAYDENGSYPISNMVCSYQASWETGTFGTALEPYMQTMATDPVNGNTGPSFFGDDFNYCYYSPPSGVRPGDWYFLAFLLENEDMELDLGDGVNDCDGTFHDSGGDDGYRIVVGGTCF